MSLNEVISLYFIAFIAGIISFISPCIIPMITVYFTTITGLSIEELKNIKDKKIKLNVISSTFAFILAFTIVFTIAGGTAGWIASLFKNYLYLLNIIGGIFVILFGLNLLGVININFKSINLPENKIFGIKTGTFKAFLIGLFFAFACSHCIGPILYSILIYAGSTGSAASGMLIMFIFSIGLAVPYILVGLFMDKILFGLTKISKYMRTISNILGTIMIIFGILLLTDRYSYIVGILNKIIPYKLPFGM